jgi:mRNA interferase MazF
MSPGEVYLADFPFGAGGGTKIRPVLLLTGALGSVPEVVVAYISSVIPSPLLATDILLDPTLAEHAQTNLKTRSIVRLHKLATIHKRSVVRLLGRISQTTELDVSTRLRNLFGL